MIGIKDIIKILLKSQDKGIKTAAEETVNSHFNRIKELKIVRRYILNKYTDFREKVPDTVKLNEEKLDISIFDRDSGILTHHVCVNTWIRQIILDLNNEIRLEEDNFYE